MGHKGDLAEIRDIVAAGDVGQGGTRRASRTHQHKLHANIDTIAE